MRLYLVQHGEAKSKDEDPDRPLTGNGTRDVAAVGRLLARRGLRAGVRVLHSGKTRARETAEILAAEIEGLPESEEGGDLQPLDDPAVWVERLRGVMGDVMLVGHLPHLSRLAAYLLTGTGEREVVGFQMGGVLCLERNRDGAWTVRWYVTPAVAEHVAPGP